jgi:hypothetical protein
MLATWNCWDSLSRDEHISGRKLEYPGKKIRNEEIMEKVQTALCHSHQAKRWKNTTRFKKKLEICNIRENIWRKKKKSSTVSLKDFQIRKISGEKYRIP